MAVTFMTGFEAQQFGADGIYMLTGAAAYSTAEARTGVASLRCNPASGATGYIRLGVSNPGYVHFGLYIASLPTVNRVIFGQIAYVTLSLAADGQLICTTGGSESSTGFTLTTGVWYWIGVRSQNGTSVPFVQVDGVNETALRTGTPTSSIPWIGFQLTESSAADIYIDDIIVNSDGFLPPSKVDIALPISDNARTAVTTGAGGTTNLWDAVNNIPPAGVASASETATTNIKFPASAAESYTANLETYTTLGVGASDTVLAVQSTIRHGEDVATGTKNGTLGAVTNPTIPDALAFVFGGDSGAHGADTPGIWASTFGTLKILPTVTLGTSPTLTVTRASESRVGCADFMGLVVAWTPPATATDEEFPYVGGGYYP